MADLLVGTVDGEPQLQFDRNKALPAHQLAFLSKMDKEMASGIVINGANIEKPDLQQRAQFVAINLLQAIFDNDEQKAAAMTSYLATYLSDLKQVKAEVKDEGVLVDLVFDQAYVNQVAVQFTPTPRASKKKLN